MQLVKFGHFFFLEVTNLLLSILQISIDIFLLIFHAFLLVLQITNI